MAGHHPIFQKTFSGPILSREAVLERIALTQDRRCPDGIQVTFTRMNRILSLDQENRTATVEPGVINLDLDNYARKFGLRYAPDPSSQRACSLGGNIAENAGGPHCLAYGTTTNHVLGMEVVLEDGSVVSLGGVTEAPPFETPGYDLRGVFVGSEGTFGVATKIVVRLLPLPESVKTFLGVFPDVDSACTAVSAIIGHGIVPAALEMVDALTIQAVQSVMDGAAGGAGEPTVTELSLLGITGVTAGNLSSIQSAIAGNDSSGVDSVSELQTMVDSYNAVLSAADGTADSEEYRASGNAGPRGGGQVLLGITCQLPTST